MCTLEAVDYYRFDKLHVEQLFKFFKFVFENLICFNFKASVTVKYFFDLFFPKSKFSFLYLLYSYLYTVVKMCGNKQGWAPRSFPFLSLQTFYFVLHIKNTIGSIR